MTQTDKQRHMRSPTEWRAWLQRHHATATHLWVVLYKKHTGKPSVTYDEAVETALCFGWIDGVRQRVDDERHRIRFTPRRKKSTWSALNKQRVRKLIREGRMTPAGLAKVDEAKANGQWDRAVVREDFTRVPTELAEALAANTEARQNFEKLAPSYRKPFIYWISSAKRDETRRKRAAQAAALLALNRRPGIGQRPPET